jgi:hypothetical protein
MLSPERASSLRAQISRFFQPHDWAPVNATYVTCLGLCVAGTAIIFAVRNSTDERNPRLVEIGLSILRVDPKKEAQVAGVRKWALDLIDANAGGVRFSAEARAALMQQSLNVSDSTSAGDDARSARPTSRR